MILKLKYSDRTVQTFLEIKYVPKGEIGWFQQTYFQNTQIEILERRRLTNRLNALISLTFGTTRNNPNNALST